MRAAGGARRPAGAATSTSGLPGHLRSGRGRLAGGIRPQRIVDGSSMFRQRGSVHLKLLTAMSKTKPASELCDDHIAARSLLDHAFYIAWSEGQLPTRRAEGLRAGLRQLHPHGRRRLGPHRRAPHRRDRSRPRRSVEQHLRRRPGNRRRRRTADAGSPRSGRSRAWPVRAGGARMPWARCTPLRRSSPTPPSRSSPACGRTTATCPNAAANTFACTATTTTSPPISPRRSTRWRPRTRRARSLLASG